MCLPAESGRKCRQGLTHFNILFSRKTIKQTKNRCWKWGRLKVPENQSTEIKEAQRAEGETAQLVIISCGVYIYEPPILYYA